VNALKNAERRVSRAIEELERLLSLGKARPQ
jgi:hypothetical protein